MTDPAPLTPAELDAIEARTKAADPNCGVYGEHALEDGDLRFLERAHSDVRRLVESLRAAWNRIEKLEDRIDDLDADERG